MSNNNPTSAAAMDALNLDDLFNCDDDDPNDSLFDDMDIDLGDISGVFHDDGDVMNLELGRMNFGGSGLRRAHVGAGGMSATAVSQGKKRGSKVALTHAQIVAKLGIKSDSEKSAAAAPPAEKESSRIRTRREAQQRSFTVEVETSHASSKSTAVTTVVRTEEVNDKEMQNAILSVSKFGLGASMQFYPYMKLPVEVELKKGQKVSMSSIDCLYIKMQHLTILSSQLDLPLPRKSKPLIRTRKGLQKIQRRPSLE